MGSETTAAVVGWLRWRAACTLYPAWWRASVRRSAEGGGVAVVRVRSYDFYTGALYVAAESVGFAKSLCARVSLGRGFLSCVQVVGRDDAEGVTDLGDLRTQW